jgi:hypothetical protein
MFPDGRADLLCVPSRGDDCVTSGQRRLGNVDAQATAGAGDQPNLFVAHAVARPSAGILLDLLDRSPLCGDRLVSVYTTQLQAQETIQPAPTSGPHLAHLESGDRIGARQRATYETLTSNAVAGELVGRAPDLLSVVAPPHRRQSSLEGNAANDTDSGRYRRERQARTSRRRSLDRGRLGGGQLRPRPLS